jgi:hypothetical protein
VVLAYKEPHGPNLIAAQRPPPLGVGVSLSGRLADGPVAGEADSGGVLLSWLCWLLLLTLCGVTTGCRHPENFSKGLGF